MNRYGNRLCSFVYLNRLEFITKAPFLSENKKRKAAREGRVVVNVNLVPRSSTFSRPALSGRLGKSQRSAVTSKI